MLIYLRLVIHIYLVHLGIVIKQEHEDRRRIFHLWHHGDAQNESRAFCEFRIFILK